VVGTGTTSPPGVVLASIATDIEAFTADDEALIAIVSLTSIGIVGTGDTDIFIVTVASPRGEATVGRALTEGLYDGIKVGFGKGKEIDGVTCGIGDTDEPTMLLLLLLLPLLLLLLFPLLLLLSAVLGGCRIVGVGDTKK
jgi:hypothetical protein